MPVEDQAIPIVPPPTASVGQIELRAIAPGERHRMLPRLRLALRQCGCFVLEGRDASLQETELLFEMPLRVTFDMYGALLAAGLELDRDSHAHLAGLCTMRRRHHHLPRRSRIVRIRLNLNFLDDAEPDDLWLAMGLA